MRIPQARPSRLLARRAGALVAAACAVLAACSDSSLTGSRQIAPETDTGSDADPDTGEPQPDATTRCAADPDCGHLSPSISPCERAFCHPTLGICRVGPRPDCCLSSADCRPSDDPCLESRCPFSGGRCVEVDICDGCLDHGACQQQVEGCGQGLCSDGQCVIEATEACCGSDTDCNDGDPCTRTRCDDGYCASVHRCDLEPCVPETTCCTTSALFATAFSPSPPWESRTSDPALRWQVLETSLAASPPHALYLGRADTLAFGSEQGWLRASVSFDLGRLPEGRMAELRFRLLDDTPATGNRGGLRVSLESDTGLIEPASMTSRGELWRYVRVELPLTAAGPWRLTFTYDGQAPPEGGWRGIFIDDIDLRARCDALTGCASDAGCQTDDPCLQGRCVQGSCQFTPNPLCEAECARDLDCADDNRCTVNTCVNGRCAASPLPSCCTSERDCADGDPCTTDLCAEDGQCLNVPVGPECRCTPELCDDGDPCTRNFCDAGGRCRATALNIPGCAPVGCTYDDECVPSGPCAVASCEQGRCQERALPGCCTSNRDCDDGNACTIGRCETGTGQCRQTLDPACACDPAACDDGDPCTRNACGPLGCETRYDPSLPGCQPLQCSADSQCDDGDGCTDSRCVNGRCQHAPIPGCCVADAACDDGDPCTSNRCEDRRCVARPIPGCGGCDPLACDDGDPCTIDSCDAAGRCTHIFDASRPECRCRVLDCDDGDPCTADSCEDGRCVHRFEANLPGCVPPECRSDEACDDGDPCTVGRCSDDGRCTHTLDATIPACRCRVLNCDDGDPCTVDSCQNGQCVHRFDPNLPGCAPPQCVGHADCDDGNGCTINRCQNGQCQSAPRSCDDGDPCTVDSCQNGQCVHAFNPNLPGCAPPQCVADADCDDGDGCTINRCQGGQCQSAPRSCDDGDPCTVDSCQNGQCVHRFNPNLPGCAPPECVADADCDDGNGCTINRCQGGQCQSRPRPCDDGDPCTADSCQSGQCVHRLDPSLPGCGPSGCRVDADCDDGDACTENRCDAATGTCTSRPSQAVGCCEVDGDCRDGNACTLDVCVPGFGICVNPTYPCDDGNPCTADSCDPARGCVFTPIPGCGGTCEETVLWQRFFDSDEGADINVEGGLLVGWRVDGVRSFSPPNAMRYGNALGTNYWTGFRTTGRATGPAIAFPSNRSAELTFRVWLDVDPEPGQDLVAVRLVSSTQNALLWQREAIAPTNYRRWIEVTVPVPAAFAGSSARVRFVFDSVDGTGNLGQGVFFDDVIIRTTCPP